MEQNDLQSAKPNSSNLPKYIAIIIPLLILVLIIGIFIPRILLKEKKQSTRVTETATKNTNSQTKDTESVIDYTKIGYPLPQVAKEMYTKTLGSLEVSVVKEPTLTWPFDMPKQHLSVKNTGTTKITQSFKTSIKGTNQEISAYPQPGILDLGPNETQNMSAILDAEAGRLTNLPEGDHIVTIVWDFAALGKLETPISIKVVKVEAGRPTIFPQGKEITWKVMDENNQPVKPDQVIVRAGAIEAVVNITTNGFSSKLPPSQNWIIEARKTGYETTFAFLDDLSSSPTLVMRKRQDSRNFQYSTVKKEIVSIGFWQGDLDKNEEYVLLPQGMEIWRRERESLKTQAKLFLYKTTGEKVWEYSSGYEMWGSDLSEDAKYAAFATKHTTRPKVGILDAKTGKLIWEKDLNIQNFPTKSSFNGHTSNEVRISPDNAILTVATGEGDLYGLDLKTGELKWSIYLKGQVRAVQYTSDGKFLFAGSGDGKLTKIKTDIGEKIWSAEIGTWPLLDGLKISPDGSFIATMTKNGQVTVIDSTTGKVNWTYDTSGIGQFITISGDSKVVVASSFGGTYGFSAKNGNRIFKYTGRKAGRFASGKDSFIMGTGNGAAIFNMLGTRISDDFNPFFDNTTGIPNGPIPGPGQFVYMSPDGERVVLASTQVDEDGVGLVFLTKN